LAQGPEEKWGRPGRIAGRVVKEVLECMRRRDPMDSEDGWAAHSIGDPCGGPRRCNEASQAPVTQTTAHRMR